MRLRMLFLFPGIIHIVIQIFFTGAKATVNSGSLTLNSGEELKINTTVPSVVKSHCSGCSFNASLQHRNSSHGDHLVAVIEFSDDIEFRSGSTVKVFGKYALSITSQNGNILIQTDINMTCGEKVFGTTCLGGFTQSLAAQSVAIDNPADLYKGLGPGGLTVKNSVFRLQNTCILGSSHGGTTSESTSNQFVPSGEAYDRQNTISLLGGSGGSCLKISGGVAGGGATELVAEKGWITLSASIIASAQSVTESSTYYCSGGAGGLIRFKAQKVEIQEEGKLNVDGGRAQQTGNTYHLGGGAGGIIQIISPNGSIATRTLSLKGGKKSGQNCYEPKHGYITVSNISNNYETFPTGRSFFWSQSSSSPSTSPSSIVTTIQQNATNNISFTRPFMPITSQVQSLGPTSALGTPTLKERVKLLMKEVEHIRTSFNANGEVNNSAIREVLSTHKKLASSTTLTKDTQDLCLEIYKKYQAIALEIAKRDPDFLEETLQNILDAASDCVQRKNHAFWRKSRQMPNLMQALEEVFIATVQEKFSPEINYTLTTTNVVVQVVRERLTTDVEDIMIPDYSEIKGFSWNEASDFVLIPKETAKKVQGNYTYVFLLYKDVENGLSDNATGRNEDDWNVSSFVMSCFLMFDDEPVKKLSPPALLTFKTLAVENKKRQCSYWNVQHRVWSIDGVQELEPNSSSTRTVCQTKHFTSFAVLVQHKKRPSSKKDRLALTIITYVGCGVSTAALIIALIVLLSIESLSSERHKIHTNLVLSLLFAQVLFLAGIKETSSKVLCKLIAVLLHYFFLTAFTWMLVEGLHLYLKVVQVFKTENVKMLYYYIFGWGFSIIPVSISVALKPNSYGNKEICWLSTEDGTVWAFIGPVIAVIAINSFILFRVVQTVVSSASSVKHSEHAHVKAGIKGLFVLMPILGVGWILGLFALNESTIVFEYAFAIINGFQGLLIFLLHCVFNNEVRTAFRRQREKKALSRENDSQYHASFSLSQSGSVESKKSSNSNSFEKLKARMSIGHKKTSKLVQVQPMSESRNVSESSLQVKRTFQEKSSNRLNVADIENEMSSLNCPIIETEERTSPKTTHLMGHQSTSKKKHNRP